MPNERINDVDSNLEGVDIMELTGGKVILWVTIVVGIK
jgi:hypothetical protein